MLGIKTKINDAIGYRNTVIPGAQADSATAVNAAMAYQTQKIKEASGEAQRFTDMLEKYQKSPEVTKKRLALETIGEIAKHADVTVVGQGQGEVFRFLNLNNAGGQK